MKDFYEEIYYPIGGINIIICSHDSDIKSVYTKKVRPALVTAEILTCLHYLSQTCTSADIYLKPSIDRVSEVLGAANSADRSLNLNKDNTRKQWKIRRPSASLIYAASQTVLENNTVTVLDSIINSSTSWNDVKPVFRAVISRAQYVEQFVLDKTTVSDRFKLSDKWEVLATPSLPARIQANLCKAFQKNRAPVSRRL